MKVWQLTDPDLPDNLHVLREIFLPTQVKGAEYSKMHYLMIEKGLRCLCKYCFVPTKQPRRSRYNK